MLPRKSLLLVPFLLAAGWLLPQQSQPLAAQTLSNAATPKKNGAQDTRRILYEVTPDITAMPPVLRVAITFDAPLPESELQNVTLQMPVWCPGDYHIQNFGKYVQDFRASDALVARDQRILSVTHPDTSTWIVQPKGASRIRVEYTLPQMPPGYFSENVFLSPRYGFVNGASALLYLTDRKTVSSRILVHVPEGWKAEMPLPPAQDKRDVPPSPSNPGKKVVAFDAPDYDTLADSPLVMVSSDAVQTFDLKLDKPGSAVYRPVYFGNAKLTSDTTDAINKMLLQIARAETTIMGGAPNPLYDFLLEENGRGGGLEHLKACRLPFFPGMSPQGFAPFAAHEFFHQWNIKRIRPRVLGPFDYVHPPHTRNLWFAEGVTDYYAYVACRRAGLLSEDRFLAHWQRAIAHMERNPARMQVTADDASWKVWEGGDSEGFGGLSYYEKGALIGLCLDLKIRHVTHNRRSLDDVMRDLYKQCTPPNPGYDEDGIRNAVNKIAGQDLTEFYNLLARSTQEMPFAECLGYAGLDVGCKPLPQTTPEQLTLRKAWSALTEGL